VGNQKPRSGTYSNDTEDGPLFDAEQWLGVGDGKEVSLANIAREQEEHNTVLGTAYA